MPSIDIQVLEGVFDAQEKQRIVERVTAAFGEVAGSVIRDGTSVRVHEVGSGAWGWGGKILHTEDGLAMKADGLRQLSEDQSI